MRCLKLNVNGVVFNGLGLSDMGDVIRDQEGFILVAFWNQFSGIYNPNNVDVMSLIYAFQWTLYISLSNCHKERAVEKENNGVTTLVFIEN